MNIFLKTFILFALVFFGISCSFVSTCSENKNYRIEYSTGGGFTGLVSGITIKCDGTVKYWERKLNSEPSVTDSTVLNSGQLKIFNEMMKNNEIFIYKNDYKGNYTARLSVSNDSSNNIFSFNPSDLPDDMPTEVKNFIKEIKNINNSKQRSE